VAHRCLEQANVSAIREMAIMITSLREFEMNQKTVRMLTDLARQENQTLT
jgi:flagellar basal body rod protein FlgG